MDHYTVPICNKPIPPIDYGWNNDSLIHMQHYLLMDILLFCFNKMLSVIEVRCLQNPHIQAYTFEAFMMCNAANVIFILLKLVYNSFTSQQHIHSWLVGITSHSPHWYLYGMVNTCIDLVYNAAPMQLLKYIPVCTVPSFFNFGFITSLLASSDSLLATGSYVSLHIIGLNSAVL